MGLQSKGEVILDMYLKRRFNYRFCKTRPDFLKNPVTGRNLEYDFYCDRLKLAIEYNGKQHYKYVPLYHKTYDDFKSQIYRDNFKKQKSKEMNISLIIIPYNFPHIEHSRPYRSFDRIVNEIYLETKKINMKNVTLSYISDMCYFLEKQLDLHGHNYYWYNRLLFKIKNLL